MKRSITTVNKSRAVFHSESKSLSTHNAKETKGTEQLCSPKKKINGEIWLEFAGEQI